MGIKALGIHHLYFGSAQGGLHGAQKVKMGDILKSAKLFEADS
jgi:hypothetical protein